MTSIPGMPGSAVALGSQLVFIEGAGPWSGGSGNSLWVSNGTAGGTFQLQDSQANSDGAGYGINSLTVSGGKLYFVAQGGSDTQLWTTDGTIAGTTELTKENAGSGGLDPSNLVDLNGTLFFTANDPANGEDSLWSSNGTTGGTTLVTDLAGSANSYSPSPSAVVSGNQLFFAASSSSSSSNVLWQSDGTAAGTEALASIPQSATNLTADGNTLFFPASDDRGNELWSAQLTQTPTPTPTPTPAPTTPPAPTATPTPTPTPIVVSKPTVPPTLSSTPTTPTPTPTTTPASTPTPAPTPTSVVIGEQPIFHRRLNKRGKPSGRAVLAGFTLEFSRPMAASAGSAADYQVEKVRAKATRGKLEQLGGVGFRVTYDTSNNTAT